MSIIQAKIATILNPHAAAINAGSAKGVAVGDIARVVKRTDVFDPDTKQSLGKVTTPIVNLRVTSVAPDFCIANTFEPAVTAGDIFALIAARGVYPNDPVQQISEVPDPLGKAITLRVGSEVDIERPAPAKPPSTRPEGKAK